MAEWCLFGLGSFNVTAQDANSCAVAWHWKGSSHSIWEICRGLRQRNIES